MIVDFILIKEKLDDNIKIVLEIISGQSPLLELVPNKIHHEGNKGTYETTEHKQKDLEMNEISSSFTLTKKEEENITYNEILEKYIKAGKDMAAQKERIFLQKINKAVEEVGNVVNCSKSLPFHERCLKVLETISIDFLDDDRNKPVKPSIVMSPEDGIKAKDEESKMTQKDKLEFDKKEKEILDKKFKEYQIRESKRVLID